MSITEMSPWQLFLKGGPIMWPILLCSIFACAIVIEKAIFFFLIDKEDVRLLKEKVFASVHRRDIKAAVAACEASKAPLARILKAGLLKHNKGREDIKEAMEEASQFEVPVLEKRLPALGTIGNIAPLLGLLGTVTGMTASFHTIQVRAAAMNPVTPGDIAGGIWEALLTTVAGLVVAIPTFVAYNYFISRVNKTTLQMEKGAADLVHLLTQVTETAA
ncbi:MAG: MotA/TolQ/ExbB proton channel family protein [Elusimicrobia bacterium]|nr:MotA/TolQ/ExbB proton channel family protein [Elusimicrobiota bacterium]